MSGSKEQLEKYRSELSKIAGNLGILGRAQLETRILASCVARVAKIAARLSPERLPDLLDCVAAELGLRIVEVENKKDIDTLLKEIPASTEPAMARVPLEFDDKTDALVIRRIGQKSWEPPYLAVINAMGWHRNRRYFSKWHEIGHLLAEGRQLDFAFRKTSFVSGERAEPLEKIVDKIAGSLAFYSPIFRPALDQVIGVDRKISFSAIEKVRSTVIPEASLEATTMACIEESDRPMLYLRAAWAHKKSESDILQTPDLFPETRQVPEKKLRVAKAVPNSAARDIFRVFRHMSVPAGSIVERAFSEKSDAVGVEDLALWPSAGRHHAMRVECRMQQDGVVALLTIQ